MSSTESASASVTVKKPLTVAFPLAIKFTVLISLLMMIALTVSFLILGANLLNENKKIFSESFMSETTTLVKFFSDSIADALRLDDDLLLIQAFDKVKSMGNVEFAVLFDKEWKVKLHSELYNKQNWDPEKIETLKQLFNKRGLVITPAFDPKVLRSSYTITQTLYDDKDRFYGMLLVRYTTHRLKELLVGMSKIFVKILLIVLVGSLVVAVLFSAVFSMWTVRPIRVMVESTGIVGAGNLNYEIPIKRNDELGLLSDEFNKMTRRIRDDQKLLLDKKVQEGQILVAKEIQVSGYPETGLIDEDLEIQGYSQAAKGIGGDYFFYRKLNENDYFFILGDISGKGVPAALLSFSLGIVVNTVMSHSEGKNAGQLVIEINRNIAPSLEKNGRFATLMLCLFDRKNQKISFASAGHGELMIFRKATQEFEKILCSGLPLGVDADYLYEVAEVVLEKGDSIPLFTDGITESRNTAKEEYGLDRFVEIYKRIQGESILKQLELLRADFDQFSAGMPQFDDMTFIIFKNAKETVVDQVG